MQIAFVLSAYLKHALPQCTQSNKVDLLEKVSFVCEVPLKCHFKMNVSTRKMASGVASKDIKERVCEYVKQETSQTLHAPSLCNPACVCPICELVLHGMYLQIGT